MGRVPLARLQLTQERLRFAAGLAGIAFAAMLMLMQLGFRDALLDSATLVLERLNCDLVLVSPQYQYLLSTKSFSERRLYQALAAEGVESVAPIYVGLATWKNPETQQDNLILALGFDIRTRAFDLEGVRENQKLIALPDVVLADRRARPEFGPIAEEFRKRHSVVTEINGRRVKVSGLFDLGTSFGVNGTLITSDSNFCRIVSTREKGMIDIGLITLKPGADAARITAKLAALSDDVRGLTREAFLEQEKTYWAKSSPVGFIFNLGTFMGLIVGAVIVYQILYSDVSDHLAEYATLKAIGYSDRFLFRVVLQEALILSVLGFLPGFAIARSLYDLTYRATFLPIHMTVGRGLLVFCLTVVMCCGAGAFAVRKLRAADPAEIF
jgi:putative ABC transport system permease protein